MKIRKAEQKTASKKHKKFFSAKGVFIMETFEQIKTYLLQHATELVIKLVIEFFILFICRKLFKQML